MKVSLLGPVEVRDDDGALLELGGSRLRTLLVRLAVEPGRTISRDALVDAVWGDEPPDNVANALQQLISRLRRTGVPVRASGTGYQLEIDSSDIDIFAGQPMPWRGPALADVADADFAQSHIARLTERRVQAEEDSADLSMLEGLITAYPLRERPVLLKMRLLADAGRPAEALVEFERFRELLADELGTDPSDELKELHLAILRTPQTPRLKVAITSFVGRDEDLAGVRDLLKHARLVTLTGPGGSGKTRLALELARRGAYLVELAPLGDAEEVAPAILAALGLREHNLLKQGLSTADPVERVIGALSQRRALLVLDNCEHLLDEIARVTESVLGSCPQVQILATSREPIGIMGESLWPVLPLDDVDARQLLTERAAAAAPGVLLDDHGAALLCQALDGMPLAIELAAARLRTMPLEQLLSKLDDRFRLLTGGSRTALPRHQTLRAVVDWSWELISESERRVWERLALFHGGATLPAVSHVCGHDVLDELTALTEKSLVVVDGDHYRMLQTICEYGVDRLNESGERSAVEKKHAEYFLTLAETAEPHLRQPSQLEWLARLRQEHDNLNAALRRSISAEDRDTAFRLVAALGWYWWLSGFRAEGGTLAAEALVLDIGTGDPESRAIAYSTAAINRLDAHGDWEAAGKWFAKAAELIEGRELEHPMLKLVAPMQTMNFWDLGGAEQSLKEYLRLFNEADPWVQATARTFFAHSLLNLGREHPRAKAEFEKALSLYRGVGDRWGMSLTLEALAMLAAQHGRFAESADYAQESIALLTALGTTEELLNPIMRLVNIHWLLGQRDEALAQLNEMREIGERVGLPFVLAIMEFTSASIDRLSGDLTSARRRQAVVCDIMDQQALTVSQLRAVIASGDALLYAAEGDLVGARAWHTKALEYALSSSDYPVIGLILVHCADLLIREGNAVLAATMLGAAEALNGSVDHSIVDRPRIESSVRGSLGEQRFVAAYRQGQTATFDSVAALSGLPINASSASAGQVVRRSTQ